MKIKLSHLLPRKLKKKTKTKKISNQNIKKKKSVGKKLRKHLVNNQKYHRIRMR
jgi:hypothetical protein